MKTLFTVFFILTILSGFGQSLCDTVDGEVTIYTYLEKMPSSNLTFGQLENIINETIDLTNYNLSEGDTFIISFIINCNGEDTDFKIYHLENEDLKGRLIKIFKKI
jgi:hypothetical protein